MSIKKGITSKQATTTLQGQRKQNTQITINNLFTFIEILRRQRYSPSFSIRLLTLRYKIQDRTRNGSSERIQSVLCKGTLRVKIIIVV